MEHSTTMEISADVEIVWAALASPLGWPDWMDGVKVVVPVTPGTRPVAGAVYRVSKPWWAFSVGEVRLCESEPPRRLVMSASPPAGTITFEYTLRPLPGGRTAVDLFVSSPGIGEGVAGPLIQRRLVAQASQLRLHCEALARSEAVRAL